MTQEQTVASLESGALIPYSFKKMTYRKFQSVVESLEDSRTIKDRVERNRVTEEAIDALVTNSKQILDEAASADVHDIIVKAIEFNQGSDADAKKSE